MYGTFSHVHDVRTLNVTVEVDNENKIISLIQVDVNKMNSPMSDVNYCSAACAASEQIDETVMKNDRAICDPSVLSD